MLDATRSKLSQRTFHSGFLVDDGADAMRFGKPTLDLQKVFDSEWLGCAVVSRYSVEDLDSLFVPPLATEIFGRLMKVEEEEPEEESQQSHGTHREHQVSPAHVVGPFTLTSRRVGAAREVGEEAPRGSCWDDLADGPPHSQDLQKVLVRPGQELEKDGAVDGNCARNDQISDVRKALEEFQAYDSPQRRSRRTRLAQHNPQSLSLLLRIGRRHLQ